MTEDSKTIDPKALDSLSIAAPDPEAESEPHENDQIHHPRQNAGQDESIMKRLENDPENEDARLDAALDESMDASDPPASTQPVHNVTPPASSGFDAKAEEKIQADRK